MTDIFDLAGKTCVLTGATGLLGREFADALASHGARVVLADRSMDECEALAAKLAERHPAAQLLPFAVNIVDPIAVSELREFVVARCGGLDALINNAAIDDKFEDTGEAPWACSFEATPIERWRQVIDVNVTGAFLCCQRLGPLMVERGSGSIVNIASTYGLVAPQQDLYRTPQGRQTFFKGAAYPTSKSALIGFTRYLASYWGSRGVRVNALCPGGVQNGQTSFFVSEYSRRTPLGRMAKPDDYRAALVFLVSPASSYMTGANLVVDGGWTTW
jgi:NAD(P)-dependent dehydrogenase (short-subunit alcohol dehydrogenase family)